jgi:hypothetical protein
LIFNLLDEEKYLGGFLDRSKRYGIYVTVKRIFGVDYGRRIIHSFLILVGLVAAYLALFVILLSPIISVNIALPLPILVGLVPFLYLVARSTRPQFRSSPAEVIAPKFEIMKEQILEIAIQKPDIVRGWGKLVIRLKSAGFMEFRLVGSRQFRQVSKLMEQFCSRTGVQLVESN